MTKRLPTRNPFRIIRQFIHIETAGGILLLSAAVLALIIDNSPWHVYYDNFLHFRLVVELGIVAIKKPVLDWINEGLMSVFFLLVGLEIKRELLQGELNSKAKAVLPAIAAIGGMIVPALIFVAANSNDKMALRGFGVPTATDIAFALGVLALLRSRVPMALKIFLMAVAIFDDIGAILIIALFYTTAISIPLLALAGVSLLILVLMNLRNVRGILPYCLVGLVLWLCVLESGVHATLAGVVLGAIIPLRLKGKNDSPLRMLEERLHPLVAFVVLPLFGFANAGIPLQGLHLNALLSPLTMGIVAGLFIGKQIGIWGTSWLAVRMGIAQLPREVTWRLLYGCALICGVGFTMSLFIAGLAFNQVAGNYAMMARLGILIGSVLSGVIGYLFLRFFAVGPFCNTILSLKRIKDGKE